MILELKLLLGIVLAFAIVRFFAIVYVVRIYKRLKPHASAWKTLDRPAIEEFVKSGEYKTRGDSKLDAQCRILVFWQRSNGILKVVTYGVVGWIVLASLIGLLY